MDFKLVAEVALRKAEQLVREWLPGGKFQGQEWSCGSLAGDKGNSTKINIRTGKWADFATEQRGGDLISLYAAINSCTQGQAVRAIAEQLSIDLKGGPGGEEKAPEPKSISVGRITDMAKNALNLDHKVLGKPKQVYEYHNVDGDLVCIIARYEGKEGKKQYRPFVIVDGAWQSKGHPEPRPLYDVHLLTSRVLIVEGEKCARAAKKFVGDRYCVTTWMNGVNSVDKTDWSPLFGKDILIWPDHDEPGSMAAREIAAKLVNKCPSVKIIDTSQDDLPEGWDAADSEFTWDEFLNFAKPRAKLVTPVKKEEPKKPKPEPKKQVVSGNVPANVERLGLQVYGDKVKKPYENLSNIVKILLSDYGDKIWFDEFHSTVFIQMDDKPEKLSNYHIAAITTMLQTVYGLFKAPTRLVEEAILFAAKHRKRNEVMEWMESLKWDRTERVETFFIKYMGAKDSEYTRAVSKNFWISLVARTYKPGCKSDSMVILEGKQGSYKSTALKVIAGDWFAETNTSPGDKDFYLALQSCLILEIAELDSFSKTEANTIKKALSSATDRFRAPYAKAIEEWPRRSVFVGTTNNLDYLKDETGARRFWPIATGKINIDGIREHRNAFFAEAVYLFKAGHKWTEVPEEAARLEQESRYQEDIWTDPIIGYVKNLHEVQIYDVLKSGLLIDEARMDQRMRLRVAKVLISNGFTRDSSPRKTGSKSYRVYKRVEPISNAPSIVHQLPLERKVRNYAPGMDDG